MNEKDNYIKILEDEVEKLKDEIQKRQIALVRIYRIFGEDMHICKLNLDLPSRIAWMQKIAQIASATTVSVKQAEDKPIKLDNVEPIKKPKVVGVGMAGEKSGY